MPARSARTSPLSGNAEEEVERLKKHGLTVSVSKEAIAGQIWFRVHIGRYNDEQEARAAGLALKKTGLISYFNPLKKKAEDLTQ